MGVLPVIIHFILGLSMIHEPFWGSPIYGNPILQQLYKCVMFAGFVLRRIEARAAGNQSFVSYQVLLLPVKQIP